jgi:hypothetical protein
VKAPSDALELRHPTRHLIFGLLCPLRVSRLGIEFSQVLFCHFVRRALLLDSGYLTRSAPPLEASTDYDPGNNPG